MTLLDLFFFIYIYIYAYLLNVIFFVNEMTPKISAIDLQAYLVKKKRFVAGGAPTQADSRPHPALPNPSLAHLFLGDFISSIGPHQCD